MKLMVIVLMCVAACLGADSDTYDDCMRQCAEVGEIHCPFIPASCGAGYELKSCSAGFTAPGDCCLKCVQSDGKFHLFRPNTYVIIFYSLVLLGWVS